MTASGLGIQEIHSAWDGYCIGVKGASTSIRAAVRAGPCNGQPDQKWDIQAGGNQGGAWNPYWVAINVHSHLCMNFQYDRYGNGTHIIQYWCNNADPADELGMDASWTSDSGPHARFIIHHHSIYLPECMAIPGNAYKQSANLIEWDCESAANGSAGGPYPNFEFREYPGGG